MTNNYSDINIEWVGEILAIHGYGVTARRLLKPLIEGGAKVKLIPDEEYLPEHKKITDPYWLDQINKSKEMPDAPVRICYCIPPRFKPRGGAINIGNSQWETSLYPKEWIQHINRMDRFWVGTKSLEMSATNGGVTIPVDTVDATIDPDEWCVDGHIANIAEVPKDAVKFMFVGDWIPRKNYEDLIIGYLTAFSGRNDVALIIKTWSNQAGEEGRKHIQNVIGDFSNKLIGIPKPKIYLLTDMMPEEQLIGLMRSADSYISVSHGEGFDLPLVQAMALQKLIVATPFLAHSDYLTEENSLRVKFTLTPVYDAVAPLYHAYQLWSKPDMLDFIIKLRRAYDMVKSGEAVKLQEQARKDVITRFSPENNTPKIVESIKKALPPSEKRDSLSVQAIANAIQGLNL